MKTGTRTIRFAGVPVEARKTIKADIRKNLNGEEFLVCSDSQADARARRYIRDSLWAFRPEFIASHARVDLDDGAVKALAESQGKLCEGANELVFALIKSFKRFWREAVSADGRGHFLNTYDGNEHEVKVGDSFFYVYRVN